MVASSERVVSMNEVCPLCNNKWNGIFYKTNKNVYICPFCVEKIVEQKGKSFVDFTKSVYDDIRMGNKITSNKKDDDPITEKIEEALKTLVMIDEYGYFQGTFIEKGMYFSKKNKNNYLEFFNRRKKLSKKQLKVMINAMKMAQKHNYFVSDKGKELIKELEELMEEGDS